MIAKSEVHQISRARGSRVAVSGVGGHQVITDLKNMADYIALQYFVFSQEDLATFTTNEGW